MIEACHDLAQRLLNECSQIIAEYSIKNLETRIREQAESLFNNFVSSTLLPQLNALFTSILNSELQTLKSSRPEIDAHLSSLKLTRDSISSITEQCISEKQCAQALQSLGSLYSQFIEQKTSLQDNCDYEVSLDMQLEASSLAQLIQKAVKVQKREHNQIKNIGKSPSSKQIRSESLSTSESKAKVNNPGQQIAIRTGFTQQNKPNIIEVDLTPRKQLEGRFSKLGEEEKTIKDQKWPLECKQDYNSTRFTVLTLQVDQVSNSLNLREQACNLNLGRGEFQFNFSTEQAYRKVRRKKQIQLETNFMHEGVEWVQGGRYLEISEQRNDINYSLFQYKARLDNTKIGVGEFLSQLEEQKKTWWIYSISVVNSI